MSGPRRRYSSIQAGRLSQSGLDVCPAYGDAIYLTIQAVLKKLGLGGCPAHSCAIQHRLLHAYLLVGFSPNVQIQLEAFPDSGIIYLKIALYV